MGLIIFIIGGISTLYPNGLEEVDIKRDIFWIITFSYVFLNGTLDFTKSINYRVWEIKAEKEDFIKYLVKHNAYNEKNIFSIKKNNEANKRKYLKAEWILILIFGLFFYYLSISSVIQILFISFMCAHTIIGVIKYLNERNVYIDKNSFFIEENNYPRKGKFLEITTHKDSAVHKVLSNA